MTTTDDADRDLIAEIIGKGMHAGIGRGEAFTLGDMVRRSERIEGHGPHHPNPIREVWSAPDTECAPAAKETT